MKVSNRCPRPLDTYHLFDPRNNNNFDESILIWTHSTYTSNASHQTEDPARLTFRTISLGHHTQSLPTKPQCPIMGIARKWFYIKARRYRLEPLAWCNVTHSGRPFVWGKHLGGRLVQGCLGHPNVKNNFTTMQTKPHMDFNME